MQSDWNEDRKEEYSLAAKAEAARALVKTNDLNCIVV
jgi:hypothetical protein